MQAKHGILPALVASLATIAVAQNAVQLGVFGFTRISKPVDFVICGMQFQKGTNLTPATVYGDTLPTGSKIWRWNGSVYESSLYGPVFVLGQGLVTKWSSNLDLGSGQGYWVEVSGGSESILSGGVPLEDAFTNSISAGFQICSYPYPVDVEVADLGFAPSSGDKIYVWNGSNYVSSVYGPVFVLGQGLVTKWSNETLLVPAGEGFWYESVANTNWIATRPYGLD